MDNMQRTTSAIKEQLIALLEKGRAHITFDDAVKEINSQVYGKKVDGLPYTLWQLVRHIQIAQKDILEFSRDPEYQSPSWPEGYWPKANAPKDRDEWNNCLQSIRADRDAFIQLLKKTEDIFAPFPHGDGQNMLREALLIADHNAYHTGQIIAIRRILNDYN